ncbi:MAG: hypothetical protein COS14_07470 [Bacteroidetes bacterium CG02_land_8_20_14_3_00_31_25]|nr:MAG: hypothetical protein COS14_07470 [Bacteroidetes bacterium CG02_land_8_20_14_3_00_31_25]
MRFGVGNDFSKGRQADYVLSNFTTEEKKQLSTCIEQMKSAILNFGLAGIQDTMSRFNGPITFPENH